MSAAEIRAIIKTTSTLKYAWYFLLALQGTVGLLLIASFVSSRTGTLLGSLYAPLLIILEGPANIVYLVPLLIILALIIGFVKLLHFHKSVIYFILFQALLTYGRIPYIYDGHIPFIDVGEFPNVWGGAIYHFSFPSFMIWLVLLVGTILFFSRLHQLLIKTKLVRPDTLTGTR